MMNTILRKIADELNKPAPKLDYVRGMVEALVAMSGLADVGRKIGDKDAVAVFNAGFQTQKTGDTEADMLNAMAGGSLQRTKDLVAKSLES